MSSNSRPPLLQGPQAIRGAMSTPLMLALFNVLAVVTVVGVLFYTKIIYKRPAITESGERTRLQQIHASPTPPAVVGIMNFEPLTVNIASSPVEPKPADGTAKQIQGKLHYVNVGFALELRDSRQKDSLENLRPILQDKILSMLGRKQFQELTTVQGRYVLRTQIMELTNELAKKALATQDAVVTNVYFTQFLAQ